MPKVYNKYHKDAPPDAVYVGRPSIWGNPFHIDHADPTKTRELAVEAYRRWIFAPEQDFLQKKAKAQLRGRDLVCWCAPAACHANVLLEIANADT